VSFDNTNKSISIGNYIDGSIPDIVLQEKAKTLENQTHKMSYFMWSVKKDKEKTYFLTVNSDNKRHSIWHFTSDSKWQPIHDANPYDGFRGAKIVFNNLLFNLSDGSFKIGSIIEPSDLKEEPLQKYQWYIKNTGQKSFADLGGLIGADLNMDKTMEDDITGKGIVIALLEDGVEINHPDLKDSINVKKSCEFNTSNPNNPICESNPTFPNNNHGTRVAGVIAGQINGIGIRGISPKAELRIFTILDSSASENKKANIMSLGGADFSKDVDIFNQSYGSIYPFTMNIDNDITNQYKIGITNGRSGKGNIYIKSAGHQ